MYSLILLNTLELKDRYHNTCIPIKILMVALEI